jgi:hypothetical protein
MTTRRRKCKAKRVVYRVQWDGEKKSWRLTRNGVGWSVSDGEYLKSRWVRQCDAVAAARSCVDDQRLAQLVLHGKNGRIRWERTYPRWSDPERHVG